MTAAAIAPRDWRASAACRDLPADDFFPVAAPGTGAYEREAAAALAACGTCPVRVPCRDFAVGSRQEWGIWGGTAPAERAAARLSLTRGAA